MPGTTPAFRGPHGEPVPRSIAEIQYLTLGGIDQWVMIRGENIANPPLILLHGGPGFSETDMFRHYNAALERHFTVVYWDQRGAGKSFDPAIPPASMTIEQFVADLDALVDAVRARLGAQRVTILGHSWGSVIGTIYAARFPDKVAVYVGCAQVGDWLRGESLSYRYALAAARTGGHHKAERDLVAMGPPPYDTGSLMAERTWIQWLDGQLTPRALWTIGRIILHAKESSLFDVPAAFRAFRWTLDAMLDELFTIDLATRVPTLTVPTFFFLGRNDHWIPNAASLAYIDALHAPTKQVVWFEHSGHEMFMDEPDRFNAALIGTVLPVARARAMQAPRS